MKTEFVIIADRSGSMYTILHETVKGLNMTISDQKKEDGECAVTFVRFDSEHEVVFENRDIQAVEEITEEDIKPRGMTALYDAIGRTIQSVGERLVKTSKSDRPDKVIFLIMTDGEENSSQEYKADRIKEMIKHQTDKYDWLFTFLGANIDAVTTAKNIGIAMANSMTFGANAVGTQSTYSTYNSKLKGIRSGVASGCNFTADERNDAMGIR
jgi:uncharacterized protein YegL